MKLPRILFAGTKSGSGKTTAVCAVLSLLSRRGVSVAACKCGPDYIDPMFHQTVTGVPCSNLDPFFCDGELLQHLLFQNAGKRLTVLEGVMGYYDGTGADGTENSTFTVAERTKTPVILVVDAKGAAASLLAEIEGFLRFAPESRICGVLFSRMTSGSYAYLKRLLQNRLGDSVVPVGYLPELPESCCIPSRHLGLVTAAEIEDLQQKLTETADLCEKTVDLDAILALADKACELEDTANAPHRFAPIRLAVAKDNAFCFYYEDTLRLFRQMGAELCFFSPLADEPLPANCSGLLLGGGYPELYAEKLAQNTTSKNSVCAAISAGMPTIAECGGFQYLGKTLRGEKMCGVLPHDSFDTGKLVRFGYVTLTAQKDGLLGKCGTALRAHEFHYWDSSDAGSAFRAEKPNGKTWDCGVMTDTLYAGYPHLYLAANPAAAEAFYQKCLSFQEMKR